MRHTSGPPMICDQSRASFSMRRCTALYAGADFEMASTIRSAMAMMAGANSRLRATSVTTRRLLRQRIDGAQYQRHAAAGEQITGTPVSD